MVVRSMSMRAGCGDGGKIFVQLSEIENLAHAYYHTLTNDILYFLDN